MSVLDETPSSSSSDDRSAGIASLSFLLAHGGNQSPDMLPYTSQQPWSPVLPQQTGLVFASDSDSDSETAPFLQNRLEAAHFDSFVGSKLTVRLLAKEAKQQVWLSAPLAAELVMEHGADLVALAWVAQLGTLPLAAASLALATYTMIGRLVVSGICGALDTKAAQAFGGGDLEAVTTIVQRTVMFSLAHCFPLTGLLLLAPTVMSWIGVQKKLCSIVLPFIAILVPRLWIEALYRPIHGCLLVQRIALPQMVISAASIPLHFAFCYLLIFSADLGLLGAALSMTLSSVVQLVLTLLFVFSRQLQGRTLGRPTMSCFEEWRPFGRLAYAAGAMKVLEAWSVGVAILLAALLPHPASAAASVTVACSLYVVLSMPFVAGGMAVCVRVGAALGAGQAAGARLAMQAALVVAPIGWLLLAVLLVEPHSQKLLLWLFTKGDDVELIERLRGLLRLDVVMVLLIGMQAICAGVIGGTAKQAKGALVNFISFWCVGLPVGAFLAFDTPGLGWGVQGLLGGLLLGPLIQIGCYSSIVLHMNWKSEAFSAWSRVSLSG